jgi:hypothetical protein
MYQRSMARTPRVSRVRPSVPRRVISGLAPLLILYAIYITVRWLLAGRGPALGELNAERVMRWEKAFFLDWEISLQTFALHHHWLIRSANWYYVAGFLPVLIVCGVIGAWKAPAAFDWWRRVFSVSVVLALVGFALFPLTPPRLLPAGSGFVDTLVLYGPQYYGDGSGRSVFNAFGSMPTLLNEYAAMPSMHIAWSTIAVALIIAAAHRRWWSWLIAVFHVSAMAFAVVVTGNHYVLDVIVGQFVLLLAILISHPSRPEPAHVAAPVRATAGD